MVSDSAWEVSGPVAMMTSPCGNSVTSRLTTVTFGSARISRVMASEKAVRSTASAPPALTAVFSAQRMTRESHAAISAFSRPAAELRRVALRELEQTSSAKPA